MYWSSEEEGGREKAYQEMGEIDESPGHAGGATEEGEDEEPREEENKDIGGPHPRVHEPLGVPVEIGRRRRFHVHHVFLGVRISPRPVTPTIRERINKSNPKDKESLELQESIAGFSLFSAFYLWLVLIGRYVEKWGRSRKEEEEEEEEGVLSRERCG